MDFFSKVSVVIPTYNRPQLIKRAIKSVLNQLANVKILKCLLFRLKKLS